MTAHNWQLGFIVLAWDLTVVERTDMLNINLFPPLSAYPIDSVSDTFVRSFKNMFCSPSIISEAWEREAVKEIYKGDSKVNPPIIV